jgi:hypothetical protein
MMTGTTDQEGIQAMYLSYHSQPLPSVRYYGSGGLLSNVLVLPLTVVAVLDSPVVLWNRHELTRYTEFVDYFHKENRLWV